MKKRIVIGLVVVLFVLSICLSILIKYYDRISPYANSQNEYYQKIVAEILCDYPEYDYADDEERIAILRNYAYKNVLALGTADHIIDVYDVFDDDYAHFTYNLFHLYDENEAKGGFLCGGTNYSLACLYNLMGYDSVTLDLAVFDEKDEDSAIDSHVVALVELGDRWIVEDANYNVEYRDIEGSLLAVDELIELLGKGEDDQIQVVDTSSLSKPLLCNEYPQTYPYPLKFNYALRSGQLIFLADYSLEEEPFKLLYPYFAKHGFKEKQIYLYMFPYDVYRTAFDIKSIWNQFSVKRLLLL